MNYLWLIPLLPGIGAAINGLIGVRYFSRKAAGAVAWPGTSVTSTSFASSCSCSCWETTSW